MVIPIITVTMTEIIMVKRSFEISSASLACWQGGGFRVGVGVGGDVASKRRLFDRFSEESEPEPNMRR